MMDTGRPPLPGDSLTAFYLDALGRLQHSQVPFLVGGTFAFSRYTGIDRETKDLDIFVDPSDIGRALAVLAQTGYHTALPFPHWLGKVCLGEHCMDIVFSSGNGVSRVDAEWFAHAVESDVLGMQLPICPPEETIWSKSFVQERERFDGADVLHLIRAQGRTLDWERLLRRFGDNWPVLLSHLVLFRFVYPDRRNDVPQRIITELLQRQHEQPLEPDTHICRGTLLSREQYLYDLKKMGYVDARVTPNGHMTDAEAEIWTRAIQRKAG
jgi:hypothetical protein